MATHVTGNRPLARPNPGTAATQTTGHIAGSAPAPLGTYSGGLSAPPVVTPRPIDPNLALQGLGARNNIAAGDAAATQQGADLTYDYGYNPDGSLNTANPYSRAALFEEAFNNSNRGAQNSMDVWGGGYQSQLGLNAHTYAINENQNKQAYLQGIHGIQQTQAANTAANQTSLAAAGLPSLLNQSTPGA